MLLYRDKEVNVCPVLYVCSLFPGMDAYVQVYNAAYPLNIPISVHLPENVLVCLSAPVCFSTCILQALRQDVSSRLRTVSTHTAQC